MAQQLPPKYNPQETEERWFSFWAQSPLFHAQAVPGKKPFTIVIPPPNVTGVLHMGHALNNTIQDILIRARRLQGFEALWMPGTDHAGIATQNVVERQLAGQGLTRKDLGRDEFLKRVWGWKEKHGSTIIHQLKRLGCACDWPRERFTMDEGYSRAVVEVFVRLYEKGLVYRGDYIINWCPRCQTALADEEAPHRDLVGKLYYIKYPIKKSQGLPANPLRGRGAGKVSRSQGRAKAMDGIIVATTRPETMLGDTAVAVHPRDPRYKHLIGQRLILPLMEREIPVIADPMVDKKFGTGAVKVTPAHDPNDYIMGKSHDLPFINILRPDGVLNTEAGEYAGMDRFEAREAILEDLKERKLLVKTEDHPHAVGHCYRCHTVVEPYLSKQWFVRMGPLSRPAIKAVKSGAVRFHPKRWTKVYLNWMENIKDWCISRQIWWGHRLPVYYCDKCLASSVPQAPAPNKKSRGRGPEACFERGVIVSRTPPQKCPACGSTGLRQDDDVLDTWFSSWLWPFATFGWPFDAEAAGSVREKELAYFYPTSVLVTAPEIIFFWVARMIMAGCEFMGQIPFRDVCIHGTVRDEEGRKMSKSLGNSIDPLEVIKEYGADALRFSLITTAASGSDIYLSRERFEQGRNLCNKIWNAARFILMNAGEEAAAAPGEARSIQDRWILSRLNETIRRVTRCVDAFKFNEAVNLAYDFFWHDFCDRYLEIAKPTIATTQTRQMLVFVLRKTLLLFHPFMPFITEEVLGKLPGAQAAGLPAESWPAAQKSWDDKPSLKAMELVFRTVYAIRNFRRDLNLSGQSLVRARLTASAAKAKVLESVAPLIKDLGGIADLEVTCDQAAVPQSLSALIAGDAHLYLLLEGLVDIEKEKARLDKQLEETQGQLKNKERMLGNKEFVKKAPEEVVARERARLAELKEAVIRLKEVRRAFN